MASCSAGSPAPEIAGHQSDKTATDPADDLPIDEKQDETEFFEMCHENKPESPDHLKLQAILENAVDAIISIDEHGIIESANPATENLFQYAPHELLGQNVRILMPAPYQEEHDQYLANYLSSGIRKIIGNGREVTGKRQDGSTFPMHLAVSEIKFEGRRLFTGIVRDITGLKNAERQLEQLNNELEQRVRQRTEQLRDTQAELVAKEKLATLGRVSGGIAHEIRNPLNAVKTSAYYLLNAKGASEAKRKEHLERIDRQVTLIDNVITALSEVARIPDPLFRPLPAESILHQIIRDVTMPPNISVELQLPAETSAVMADEYQIPIVFRNLLRNARDAMPQGGKITIAAERRGGKVAITVSDTGTGIAQADLARILEPLYSTKARGMGLGLAICKAIVDKNGGEMQIESEVGKGSRFTIELEAAAD